MQSKSSQRLTVLERQADRVQERLYRLSAQSNRFKGMQVAVLFGGVVLTVIALSIIHVLGFVFGLCAIICFFVVIRYQRKVDLSYLKHRTLLGLVKTQIARIHLDWDAIPAVSRGDTEGEHPFDRDLDVTGERSLHQLINTAVSYEGINRLRDWLLCRVPDLEVIRKRQLLIRELAPLTRFRDKLMMNSLFSTRFSGEPIAGDKVVSWLARQRETKQRLSTLVLSVVFCALIYVAALLFIYAQFSPLFCVAALLLSLCWFLFSRREQGDLAGDAETLTFTLGQLRTIFEYLEKYPYAQHSQLRMLCEPFFLHGDRSPSLLLKKLERVTSRASMARSAEGWMVLNILLPLGAYTAYQLDSCKEQLAQYLPTWLDIWYELEALSSLANFAYLNPEYVMPEIAADKKQDTPIILRAMGLGHPLIEKEKKVVNDFSINNLGDVIMITGSNMAGKSTFLRSIGVNLCLAYAGSVVNATSLRASLFELYSCIRVTDSVIDGYSYFYAEVRRLKGLLTELESGTRYPLFFLIDEIFKGTNNVERLIGSEAYIRALVGKNCVGAISTHDLELVKIADTLPQIKNYHFREDIIDGKMVFDYILRRGPSPTRNALRIMQMEGLPVKWDTTPAIPGS